MSDEKAMIAANETSGTPFSNLASTNSSRTHIEKASDSKAPSSHCLDGDSVPPTMEHHLPGHGESALPEDKEGEAIENIEDDWEDDPENARNWPAAKKWTTIAIVSHFPASSTLQLTRAS